MNFEEYIKDNRIEFVAKQNKIFDINKDLDISVKEIETVLRRQIPEQYKKYYL